MSSRKVTVTIPDEQLAAIRQLVAEDRSPSVSGFVQHAVAVALDDVAGWQYTLDEALADSGGPLTEEERRWADEVLARGSRSVA
jgi:Arc/MetJ-type ribon-helix-helix transcriptional regulator